MKEKKKSVSIEVSVDNDEKAELLKRIMESIDFEDLTKHEVLNEKKDTPKQKSDDKK